MEDLGGMQTQVRDVCYDGCNSGLVNLSVWLNWLRFPFVFFAGTMISSRNHSSFFRRLTMFYGAGMGRIGKIS